MKRTTKTYYTLAVRSEYTNFSMWEVEFGDYDLQVVKSEHEDYRDRGHLKKNLKIISSGDSQAEVRAAVANIA